MVRRSPKKPQNGTGETKVAVPKQKEDLSIAVFLLYFVIKHGHTVLTLNGSNGWLTLWTILLENRGVCNNATWIYLHIGIQAKEYHKYDLTKYIKDGYRKPGTLKFNDNGNKETWPKPLQDLGLEPEKHRSLFGCLTDSALLAEVSAIFLVSIFCLTLTKVVSVFEFLLLFTVPVMFGSWGRRSMDPL